MRGVERPAARTLAMLAEALGPVEHSAARIVAAAIGPLDADARRRAVALALAMLGGDDEPIEPGEES